MTRDERIEALARMIWDKREIDFPKFTRQTWEQGSMQAKAIVLAIAEEALDTAYPELAAGTHWIAPREMTKEMVDAAEDRFEDFKDTTQDSYDSYLVISSGYAHGLWTAARDAYLKQEGGE